MTRGDGESRAVWYPRELALLHRARSRREPFLIPAPALPERDDETRMKRIGSIDGGEPLRLDIERLIDTRALVQGSSGSGKSWLIRGIIEKAAGLMPVIVLDMEGEFVTLREKFDMVIAGEGGEVGVDVRSAALFARRLLELKLSAVVNLSDLTVPGKRGYVRHFLEGVMSAPRSVWGPRMIVVDEAHAFAPETSQAESLGPVVDIASRGRKRGYGLIAATQRLSKLHKDVAAEMRNVFVGQTTLDVDVKRAIDTLGFAADRDSKRRLRELDHQFYAMGPALNCQGVVLFKADKPATTHPESGSRRQVAPPAPSKAIRSVLGELADLAAKAEQEAATLADSQRKIRELERQLASKAPVVDEKATERAVAAAVAVTERHWRGELAKLETAVRDRTTRLGKIEQLAHLNGEAVVSVTAPPVVARVPAVVQRPASRPLPPVDVGDVQLGKAERLILRAFYWTRDEQATPAKIGFYAGYSHKSGSFANSLSKLRSCGLLDGYHITPEGESLAAQDADAKPTGAELREWLRPKLGKCENEILDVLIDRGGERLSAEEIGAATPSQYSSASGSFANSLAKLRSIEAAVGYGREGVKAADVFFD
jgi:uncharacterized protein